MECIKQGFDSKAVASREQRAMSLIPHNNRELAAQSMQAVRAQILIQMESNFAVGSRTQAMAGCFELFLNCFVAVKFAVDDDVRAFVLAGDRLIAGGQVDDAQPRVPQGDEAIRGNPLPLPIGSAVIQTLRGSVHRRFRDRIAAREERNNSTHSLCSLAWVLRTPALRTEYRDGCHGIILVSE